MIFDWIIRLICPNYGSWFYDVRHDFIAFLVGRGNYCHFCRKFFISSKHQDRVAAMQYPKCED